MGDAGRTAVGQQLRAWRLARGRSQLSVALASGTTARHLSFVENGRSRPGAALLARLAAELELPTAAAELLRQEAGLAAAHPKADAAERSTRTMSELLAGHDPFPACLVDHLGGVRAANRAYFRLIPDALELTPEAQVDRFFSESGRRWIANWAEVAWREADRRVEHAQRSGDPRAVALSLRAIDRLGGVARPAETAASSDGLVHLVVGAGETIAHRTIVLQPDPTAHVGDRQLRLELTVPAHEHARRWLERRNAAD